MATFYNFALKIETCGAKRVVKTIFESWDANVIVYIYSFLGEKIIKTCNVKKNNFKCTKFTIKNYNNSDSIQD